MTTHRAHHRTRQARRAAVVGVTGAAVLVFSGGLAVAQDDPESTDEPPGYVAPEPPEVDPDAPGLMLGDGATLAEPRILDIKFITEDLGTGGTGDSDDGSGGTGGEDGSSTGGEDGSGGGEDSSGGGEDSGADEPPSGGQREEQTSGQHKFTLQTDVLFGRDSDEITDEAREALREVAAAIDEYQPSQVNIFGFTDNLGDYDYGITLSENRARNTQQVLVELLEDPSGITFNVRGYSEDYPLYDNSTEEGRQRNRRVEISWPTGE